MAETVIQIGDSVNSYSQKKTREQKAGLCIYRVPVEIRELKQRAYIPSVVGLGPFHHNIRRSAMNEHKKEAVIRTLARINQTSNEQVAMIQNHDNKNGETGDFDEDPKINHTSEWLVGEIEKHTNEIKDCYQDVAILRNEEALADFCEDACFILEYIRSYVGIEASQRDSSNPYFQSNVHHNDLHSSIQNDIWKLENQIPLFTLITILRLEFHEESLAINKLAELLRDFFALRPFIFCFPAWGDIELRLQHHIKNEAYHLLDLYRRIIRDMLSYSSLEDVCNSESGYYIEEAEERTHTARRGLLLCAGDVQGSNGDHKITPKAELLKKAGIKFQPGKLQCQRRWFVGTLSIPQIRVDYMTEGLLMNLMAFEECQIPTSCKPTIITQYMHLMDDLIDSENDVALLVKEGIIISRLGSDAEIAGLFNSICRRFTETKYESIEIHIREARKQYNSLFRVRVNEFKKENCSRPWYVISGVAAALILVMTAIQTFCAVKD